MIKLGGHIISACSRDSLRVQQKFGNFTEGKI